MDSSLIVIALGLIIVLLGISNRKGNINSLHSYHRHRVAEEDKEAFGKIVGLGHIVAGIACVVYGIATFVFEKTQISPVDTVGLVILIGGCAVGLGISFYGMIKYNKGIF